jgi:putative membrane protein
LGALLGPLLALAAFRWSALWGLPLGWWIVLPAPLGGALGYLLANFLDPVKRWLVGEEILESRARRRAAVAFVEQEVFRTRDRTGILLFLSLFEHRVVLLADAGIDQKVEENRWETITRRLAAGIRQGRAGPALLEAIQACGELLERHGVERRKDDRDELSNELRRGRD